jgi:N-acetyl-gamma-glutamyl-phosphate reductase
LTQARIKVAVAGATGYAGAELVRYLLQHPAVELVLAARGRADDGSAPALLADALPGLRGLTTLPLVALPKTPDAWPALDVIFLALLHGVAMDVVPLLPKGPKVIDLSGDFRIRDAEAFAAAYGFPPRHREEAPAFTYGLVENHRAAISSATHVASPGCFATACILALSPLVKADLTEDRIIIDAKTGSSGAGAKPGATTHHPERAASLFAYKPFEHQHGAEIDQALRDVAPSWSGKVILQAHATPLVRGIYASAYAQLRPGVDARAVGAAFQSHYAKSPFVRLGTTPPNVLWSRASNFVDIGWAVAGREVAVFASLDNLGKGAAGQAVQSFNLMSGLPETLGLWAPGGLP